MVTPWSTLSDKIETDIDLQFSEPVVVYPYKKAAYMSDTVPDSSRQTRNTKGYYISKYTNVRSSGAAFMTKRTEADLLIEIREEYVPDVLKDDRVYLTNRDHKWYDVSFVEYWGNGRNVLHLLKRHT